MKEIWKSIKDYEGYYEVSNLGKIRSLDRTIKQVCSKDKTKYQYNKYKGKLIKPSLINSGYYIVSLCKNKHYRKYLVHRLVAEAFLGHSILETQVNHKDENKLNNNLSNLEWCTPSYNLKFNDRSAKIGSKLGKIVYMYNNNLELLNKFSSSREASYITNIPDRGIRKACTKNRIYKNYIWSYEKLDKQES